MVDPGVANPQTEVKGFPVCRTAWEEMVFDTVISEDTTGRQHSKARKACMSAGEDIIRR